MTASATGTEAGTDTHPGSTTTYAGRRGDARAESLRGLEREVAVMVRRIKRVIGERARAVHPELQPASFLMLSWLVDEGPVRASVMAESFNIDKGAVSRQLQHLVDLDLVERTQDPHDGRAMLVSASPSAVRRLEGIADDRRRWLDERLGDWDATELDELVGLLGRYNSALEDRA